VRHYPFRHALLDAQDRGLWEGPELPLAAVVAVARLVGCYSTPPEGRGRYDHRSSAAERGGPLKLPPDQPERDLGHFGPGRYAWRLVDVTPIVPIPQRGYRQVWDWTVPGEWSGSYGRHGRAYFGLQPIAPITAVADPEGGRGADCLCGKSASGHCEVCGRGWCEPHAHHTEGGVVCTACFARLILRRRPCATCGCQPAFTGPHNAAFTPCPQGGRCACHSSAAAAGASEHRRCAFCGGTGRASGDVGCMYCGGTGRHTPPISAGGRGE
jgi:hypothetical protein